MAFAVKFARVVPPGAAPPRAAAEDAPQVRVLVVGDSGVGKTSLMNFLCGEVACSASATVGCTTHVKVHVYHSRLGPREHVVEFWDVGGRPAYELGRSTFYRGVNGIMFVYDVSNRKSYHNVRRWISEVVEAAALGSVAAGGVDALRRLPTIVVANKVDLGGTHQDTVKDLNMECMTASCVTGDVNRGSLNKFLDRVIEAKFFRGAEAAPPLLSAGSALETGGGRGAVSRPARSEGTRLVAAGDAGSERGAFDAAAFGRGRDIPSRGEPEGETPVTVRFDDFMRDLSEA